MIYLLVWAAAALVLWFWRLYKTGQKKATTDDSVAEAIRLLQSLDKLAGDYVHREFYREIGRFSSGWFGPAEVLLHSLRDFAISLVWPVAIPIYLTFNRGKTVGLKKKEMRRLIEQQEAEIARIKEKEGWS